MKIRDLAENMIRLAGLTVRTISNPGGDIEIAVTGIRPAEKLYEDLFYDPSQAVRTRQPKILRSEMGARSDVDVEAALREAHRSPGAPGRGGALRKLLFEFIDE